MDEKFDHTIDHDADAGIQPARFPVELGLPSADESLLDDAKSAVRQEYRDCSRWKRLRCRKVTVIAERDRGTVYAVHVGSAVEFDWTWEGAVAFRPSSLDDDPQANFLDFDYENAACEEENLWSGEILEVDERNGCLFISLADPERPPTVGSFFVRPFEFLSILDAVYHDPRFEVVRAEIPSRLAAAAGGIHPPVAHSGIAGLSHLQQWWQHSWNVLWGPPGTGKTYTLGQHIAEVLARDETERILVVSTTNRATDAAALSIGNAAKPKCSSLIESGNVLRVGKGASYQSFVDAGLNAMLQGTESEVLAQIDVLAQQLPLFDAWDDKALTRKQIGELRSHSNDGSKRIFVDPQVRVVVATAFKAMSLLDNDCVRKMLGSREAPFTTVFIDEAGLISRSAVAALSLLASRRVVLVGDSKQLAPISRISRILPTRQETWLASSGLSHLDDLETTPTAVHVLSEQRRMHPEVCKVVSNFQYGGILTTAPETACRESTLPSLLANGARTVWYVLDEEGQGLASIRAERGRGNRSWVRAITSNILEKLFSDPSMRQSNGLFISPYRAQSQAISQWFATQGIKSWEASTVHSQQGTEADVVIFDTVNAGSYNWPFDEWKRLVNVAISRAREAVIVLASRSEMEEPYLRPLAVSLTPCVLAQRGGQVHWKKVERGQPTRIQPSLSSTENNLGGQIATRKAMRPVLSQEQQRLSNLGLDGKPRLVRGVAGSGKSVVLSNWLAKTVRRLAGEKHFRVWAVYANRSLHKLLRECIEMAWQANGDGSPFPWNGVSLYHVKDVLAGLLPSVSMSMDSFEFDYDKAAKEFLNRQDTASILPRCDALFIDEAQDMGPNTLRLLVSLVEQADPDDNNSRSAHIFFDNAQNIYGRGTPRWSEFGLDMRGRSTIMKESFRSTNPITELAVNVLNRLAPETVSADHKELMSLGLLERVERDGQEWLRVRYNQVHGPKPIFRTYRNRVAELDAIGTHLTHLIAKEGVSPADICLIYNGKAVVRLLEARLAPKMKEIGVELSVQTTRPFERQPNTLLVTTCHSFKGYDAEVVVIPCADQYTTQDNQILATNLYVAMTRARSLLLVYSLTGGDSAAKRLNETIESCIALQNAIPAVEADDSPQDDLLDILEQIGTQHRKWLVSLWKEYRIVQEPLLDTNGQVIAEPLFWFVKDGKRFACFQPGLSPLLVETLRQHGIVVCDIEKPLESHEQPRLFQ